MLQPESVHLTVVARHLLEELAAEAPPLQATSPTPPLNGAANSHYTSRLLVDRWLTERGVAFRIKTSAEGNGRTVYVLRQCPFDPAHTDPNACIMQDQHGKMSVQCFHNSCQGRGVSVTFVGGTNDQFA